MEFDKSKVYTALNADELKIGSKIIVGDNLSELKESVLKHRLPKIIKKIESEDNEHRFLCNDDFHYALAYLMGESRQMSLLYYLMLTNYYLDLQIDCNCYTNTMTWWY